MKLATLKDETRDGTLVVVSRDLTRAIEVSDIVPTLQWALEEWADVSPDLQFVYDTLNTGYLEGEFEFARQQISAPLPRAFQWADGSAYVTHVELVRKARGAELPESFWHDPLMYQGGSDVLLGCRDPIEVIDPAWGIDYEAEIAVITDDVPMGISPDKALSHIKLLMLVNDVSLRNLIPQELAKGFGFFQSKPASSFSPVAVTPDELTTSWRDGRVHLPLYSYVNDVLLGCPNAGQDMVFNFPTLIAHAAKTRRLSAGTIIGSGTVANADPTVGSSCLAERRMREVIESGVASTEFLQYGDRIRIEMLDALGEKSIFGAIDQEVIPYDKTI